MEWCFLFVSRLLVSCIHCTQLLGPPSSLLTLSPSPCRPMAASSMNILPAALFSAVPSRCAWRVPLIEWRSNSHNFQTGLNVNGHYAQCSMLIYIILQNGAVVGWPFFFRFFYFIFFFAPIFLYIYISFRAIPFSRILLMASCKYFCSCMPCIARTRSRHIADAGMKTCRSRTMLKARVIERERERAEREFGWHCHQHYQQCLQQASGVCN